MEGIFDIELNSERHSQAADSCEFSKAPVLEQKHGIAESTSNNMKESLANRIADTSISVYPNQNTQEARKAEITFKLSDQKVYYEPHSDTTCSCRKPLTVKIN